MVDFSLNEWYCLLKLILIGLFLMVNLVIKIVFYFSWFVWDGVLLFIFVV